MTTEQRPLVPEDRDEREAERRVRQEYVKRARAESLTGTRLESREQRLMWRERQIRALMMREFQRLSYGDADLEIMPRVLAELLDLVDGMIAIAIYDERERTRRSSEEEASARKRRFRPGVQNQ
jgi:hypothetical protein